MKLYTEEQVREAFFKLKSDYDGFIYNEEEVLNELIPIELPDQEQLDKLLFHESHEYAYGFSQAIEWMKQQIEGGNQ